MSGKCRQNIIPEASSVAPDPHGKKFCFCTKTSHQSVQGFLNFSDSSCDDQFLLGSGKCHIKHTQFFAQTFSLQFPANQMLVHGRNDQSFVRKDSISSQSQLRVYQKSGIDILKIKLFSHACHKDYRKFQTFTLMDGHDLYCLASCICKIHLTKIHLIFL